MEQTELIGAAEVALFAMHAAMTTILRHVSEKDGAVVIEDLTGAIAETRDALAKAKSAPTVEAYQNCNYEPRAAFYSTVTNSQHLLRVLDERVNDRALHLALHGPIDWGKVGDFQRIESALTELVMATA
ncbi:MAG: hypothetical protein EHM35_00515 [Planctomycetaceae bacterium]|nr:MAG: hypothetical protein EHM35_00515 [Planctomycetaceae bacterium]